MKKSHIIILSLFVINAGVLLWWFSDTQVIKRQTKSLAKSLTIDKEDGKSTRALKSQNLDRLLANSLVCSVEVKQHNYEFSKSELTQAHMAMTNYCQSSSANTSDFSIDITSDTTANVTATLNLSATENGGKIHTESCLATLTWQKNDKNQWRLDRIHIQPK